MKLFYRRLGEGQPLVIIHGLYGSSDNWMKIAKQLANNFEVYLPDLRNHGQSPHSDNFSIPVMTDDLKEFLDDNKLKNINLIGHSLGGKIAMQLAANYPEYIKKLIVVDIAPRKYNDEEFAERRNHKYIINVLKNTDLSKFKNRSEALEKLSTIDSTGRLKFFMMKNIMRQKDGTLAWKINIDAIAANLSNLLNDFELDISKISAPTLFIKGEKSDYLTEKDFEILREKIPNVQFKIIKDATHWIHAEKPNIFIETVSNFLAE